ncbi:MAG: YkgJ family cysteine cluster protein [Phycisphaerales bacterium]|nr:YkgJ family cysteine cluster protein [Phycisphaerales bacterium]MCI0676110.1 YkgJ family cysteine cluster protein [Phycisphaerales bacterium]
MKLPVIQCLDATGKATCGACCMFVGRPPYPGFDRDRMGQPCTALDLTTKLCTIYERRPEVCRNVLVGGWSCQHMRRMVAR